MDEYEEFTDDDLGGFAAGVAILVIIALCALGWVWNAFA